MRIALWSLKKITFPVAVVDRSLKHIQLASDSAGGYGANRAIRERTDATPLVAAACFALYVTYLQSSPEPQQCVDSEPDTLWRGQVYGMLTGVNRESFGDRHQVRLPRTDDCIFGRYVGCERFFSACAIACAR